MAARSDSVAMIGEVLLAKIHDRREWGVKEIVLWLREYLRARPARFWFLLRFRFGLPLFYSLALALATTWTPWRKSPGRWRGYDGTQEGQSCGTPSFVNVRSVHAGSFLNSTGRFKVTNLIAAENRRSKPHRRVRLHLRNEVSVEGERDVDVGMAEHGAYFWNRGSVHQVD